MTPVIYGYWQYKVCFIANYYKINLNDHNLTVSQYFITNFRNLLENIFYFQNFFLWGSEHGES